MIASIKGTLTKKTTDKAVIDVSGVGFEVLIPASSASRLPQEGEEAMLLTSLVVREDSLTLYGFITNEEKEFFELLMTVQGVGPKSALNILSGTDPAGLVRALQQGNAALLQSIPGVGHKTAQRLIVELKDKVVKFAGLTGEELALPEEDDTIRDAMTALSNLGYRSQEAREAIRKVLRKLPAKFTVEQAVREALKNL
jgi:Holliday junction DNA helicase RuvA